MAYGLLLRDPAASLRAALTNLVIGGSSVDLASGRLFEQVSTATASLDTSLGEPTWKTAGASTTSRWDFPASVAATVYRNGRTMFLRVAVESVGSSGITYGPMLRSTISRRMGPIIVGTSPNRYWDVYVRPTSGTQYFGSASTARAVASEFANLCVTHDPLANEARLYVNGQFASAMTTSGALDSLTHLALHDASGGFLVSVAAGFNRLLTEPEIRLLSMNPWMLRRPRRILVPVSVAGGGPALSLPGVQSITTTSAQPKVTLTFS